MIEKIRIKDVVGSLIELKNKKEWNIIGEARQGKPYGHCAGHAYHDVSVTIGKRGAKFRVEVLEVWGSCQGYNRLNEDGRNRVVSIDADLESATRIANHRAKQAGIKPEYMIQALSNAHAAAVDALFDAATEDD